MVLGTGKVSLMRETDRWAVSEVSNQSTGYCPNVSSWPEIAEGYPACEAHLLPQFPTQGRKESFAGFDPRATVLMRDGGGSAGPRPSCG